MADDAPIMRHLNLLRILGARRMGVTLRDLADELGVDQRTIRRDLDRLRQAAIPVEDHTGEFGRKTWRLGESWCKAPIQFDFEEAAALYLGRQLLESMAGTPFWAAAVRAWGKIRSTFGETAANYIDRFSQVFHCAEGGNLDYSTKAEILESLTIAIEDHKIVHITYQSASATEPATREVYPLKLVRNHTGSLYLRAFTPESEGIKTYKIDRIEAVEVSSFVFQRYRDVDAVASLSGSLGIYDGTGEVAVTIEFLPAAARHARESRWHRSAEFTALRDGGLILRLRLSSTVEIKSRVLSYGASAIVLEPEDLRVEIAAELARLLEAYATPAAEAVRRTNARR